MGIGVFSILSACAWLRGATRISTHSTGLEDPKNKWEKFTRWLKKNGIDLSIGKDKGEHQTIVGHTLHGRTYGEPKGSDPRNKIRTVYSGGRHSTNTN